MTQQVYADNWIDIIEFSQIGELLSLMFVSKNCNEIVTKVLKELLPKDAKIIHVRGTEVYLLRGVPNGAYVRAHRHGIYHTTWGCTVYTTKLGLGIELGQFRERFVVISDGYRRSLEVRYINGNSRPLSVNETDKILVCNIDDIHGDVCYANCIIVADNHVYISIENSHTYLCKYGTLEVQQKNHKYHFTIDGRLFIAAKHTELSESKVVDYITNGDKLYRFAMGGYIQEIDTSLNMSI